MSENVAISSILLKEVVTNFPSIIIMGLRKEESKLFLCEIVASQTQY